MFWKVIQWCWRRKFWVSRPTSATPTLLPLTSTTKPVLMGNLESVTKPGWNQTLRFNTFSWTLGYIIHCVVHQYAIYKEISFKFEPEFTVDVKFSSGCFPSQECPERQERLPACWPGDDGGLHPHRRVRLVSYLSVMWSGMVITCRNLRLTWSKPSNSIWVSMFSF